MTEDKKLILLLDFILRINPVDYNNILESMITVFKNMGKYSISIEQGEFYEY